MTQTYRTVHSVADVTAWIVPSELKRPQSRGHSAHTGAKHRGLGSGHGSSESAVVRRCRAMGTPHTLQGPQSTPRPLRGKMTKFHYLPTSRLQQSRHAAVPSVAGGAQISGLGPPVPTPASITQNQSTNYYNTWESRHQHGVTPTPQHTLWTPEYTQIRFHVPMAVTLG